MGSRLAILVLTAAVAAGSGARGDDDCRVPMADWQPRGAVRALAEAQGWVVRRLRIDDGCYRIDGRDRDGRRIEVRLDPATLAVLRVEHEEETGTGDGD